MESNILALDGWIHFTVTKYSRQTGLLAILMLTKHDELKKIIWFTVCKH